ncbi:MAG: glycosyltransferase family 4 protein [Candidatus Fermentibacteraceae bacterium]|nr:glycosyltransferase family 4 protein [Candidatus Fermentibacteraceae bacterium]MBN2607627.1 glycosyltransferase family 4 protein [Candidatus Fermentibacteraceae bacterium]
MSEIRVAFDLSSVPHALGGVSRYLLSLAEALVTAAPERGIEPVLVDVEAAHPGVPGPGAMCRVVPTPLYMEIPLLRRIPIRRGWEESSRAGRIGRRTGWPRVYHHSGVQPFNPPGSVSVVTVYDFSALDHPEWHTRDTVSYAGVEEEMLRSGSYAAAISSWTGHSLSGRLGIPEEMVYAAGGAADDDFSPGDPSPEIMEEYGLEPFGYLLHVGNFVPRKNIPFLVDVYRESRKEGMDVTLVLVTEGGWGGVTVAEGDGVRILHRVPDVHMPHLYRGARALLMPSEYEGLGLPVLEAFACGTPVISSDSAALKETVGQNGALIPAGDGRAWLSQLKSLSDPARIEVLRRMSASAHRRRWSDVAEGLCDFYRKIAGR